MVKYDNLVQKFYDIVRRYQSAVSQITSYIDNVDDSSVKVVVEDTIKMFKAMDKKILVEGVENGCLGLKLREPLVYKGRSFMMHGLKGVCLSCYGKTWHAKMPENP